jgi:transcriptional regulator with XRE-family HTH domain
MLQAEKRFIDKIIATGGKLSKDVLFQKPWVLVRALRKRLRMTQTQLGQRVGLSQSHIARMESGKVSPTLETLDKIFQAMGCSLTFLLVAKTPPDKLLQQQALRVAQNRMSYVAGTMSLEAQRPSGKVLHNMILSEQKKILDSKTAKIWDV